MPRIDPLQLLKCLSVLLTPEGGILSRDEVPRLVNLMTKFSKKLVSKCVYVLILTNTEVSLLDLFMAEGGWTLIQTWLEDAMRTANDDLVVEILKLLLISPVDVERLKMNTIPRLVKTLTKREDSCGVKEFSTELVQKWLSIVKSTAQEATAARHSQVTQQDEVQTQVETVECGAEVTVDQSAKADEVTMGGSVTEKDTISEDNAEKYKLTVRDGKQVIKRVSSTEDVITNSIETDADKSASISIDVDDDKNDSEEQEKKKSKSEKTKSKSSSSSSKSSSSKSSSSSKEKEKDRHKSSSSRSSSSSKDKSSSSSKDKDRDRKDKDKHRSNGSVKHSSSSKSSSSSSGSSSSKDKKDGTKEKQAEKDKDTLAKIKPQTLEKIGRIPKKNEEIAAKENKDIKKKGTMSIEVRKSNEERPKTVKVFNSKMRSTGLEEAVKPPPPRTAIKKPSSTLPTIPQKRPSPPREIVVPVKKAKIELPERPGAIKLIPPKPKPAMLQESDLFMDALTASANTKKEPKKRKRRASVSKDSTGSPPSSPTKDQQSPTNTSSPIAIKNIAPPNFYQDTLDTNEENKEAEESVATDENSDKIEDKEDAPTTPVVDKEDDSPESPKAVKPGGLKGVLVHVKKKGPKRSIRWKPDIDLVEIRHFELDETERINVTKTFMDMAKMDITSEREAIQLSRKTPSEDLMETQMSWRFPFSIDQPDVTIQPGGKSLEKDIQFAREKSVLQALYFNKRAIPDSAAEPIPENHQMSDPIMIPLEDPDSQELDLRNTPWPDPKTTPPMEHDVVPPMFRNMVPNQFSTFPQINPPSFQGIPPQFNVQGPNGPPMMDGPPFMGPQTGFVPPNIMGNMIGPPNNNMMGPPRDMMGPIDPNVFGPGGPGPVVPGPDGFSPMMNDDGFNNMNNMPFNPPNMGMFPPNNYNMNRGGGGGGHRGNYRRGGNSGGWVRMNNGHGGGKWNNRSGGGPRGNRLCKNFKNHGYCRNIDNCPFVHPN